MLNRAECSSKADEMDRLATRHAASVWLHDEFIGLAFQWRVAAAEAARQDALSLILNNRR